MSKRFNHQALTEAIKQGQARMKRTMLEPKTDPEIKAAEPPKQAEKERVHIGIGTIPSRRKKPLQINRSYIIVSTLILIGLLVVYLVVRSSGPAENPVSEPAGGMEIAQQQPAEPSPVPPEPVRSRPQETARPVQQAPEPAALHSSKLLL